jgi:uncharacterized protein YjbJ (UPF0337 family)
MPYSKPPYPYHDHFNCERVLEFRKRFHCRQFKERWDQLKGALQKQWRALTDDDLLRIEGDQERFNGAIRKRYGEQRHEVNEWLDRWYARFEKKTIHDLNRESE